MKSILNERTNKSHNSSMDTGSGDNDFNLARISIVLDVSGRQYEFLKRQGERDFIVVAPDACEGDIQSLLDLANNFDLCDAVCAYLEPVMMDSIE